MHAAYNYTESHHISHLLMIFGIVILPNKNYTAIISFLATRPLMRRTLHDRLTDPVYRRRLAVIPLTRNHITWIFNEVLTKNQSILSFR